MIKLSTLVNKISDSRDGATILAMLKGVYDRMQNQIFSTAGVAIGGTTTKVKIATAFNYIAKGILCSKAITDDFWTLSGVVSDGYTNVFCFYIDSAGTASSLMGTQITTVTAGYLAPGLLFPPTPEGKAMVGFVIVSASGGDFTGGSSNVATAGNFTVTFVQTIGAMWDSTAEL